MQDSKDDWELPWPALDVPSYRETRIGPWYVKTSPLLVRKGYFQTWPTGGIQLFTMLVSDAGDRPKTVMATLPMELESNAPHVAAAKGNVVIMGVGMGLTLFNILMKPETSQVVVVEHDPTIVQLLHEAADVENWVGFEKLTIINSDAFRFVPEQQVDWLYVDIWDHLGDEYALSQTQQIQSSVNADLVSWWGQEIQFLRWLIGKGSQLPPTLQQYRQWAEEINLPVIERDNPEYMTLVQAVSQNFASLVGIEEGVEDGNPVQESLAPAPPEGMLDKAHAADGSELVLCERRGEFGILVDGRQLMSSENSASERHLASLCCAALGSRMRPRVVIGGLGMGFTLRAALDALPADAQVIVVEVVPAVVEWNRGRLAHLTHHPLNDARVTVEVADLDDWLQRDSERFDAILLDVDNGPAELTLESNRALYSADGLARAARKLNLGGVLGIWSTIRVRDFERRLIDAGLQTDIHQIPGRFAIQGLDHIVYVART